MKKGDIAVKNSFFYMNCACNTLSEKQNKISAENTCPFPQIFAVKRVVGVRIIS